MSSTSVINFSGNCYEDGACPPSNPGDQMQAVGIVNGIKRPLYWSPSRYSYTWYVGGLTSLGESVYGTTHVMDYMGGSFEIHVDGLPSNASYGVNPPNATAPETFRDGHGLYLKGTFSSFTMLINTATSSGSVVGTLTFTEGNAFPNLTSAEGWTVAATIFGSEPLGFDADWNGALFVSGPASVEDQSWASVKSLYR